LEWIIDLKQLTSMEGTLLYTEGTGAPQGPSLLTQIAIGHAKLHRVSLSVSICVVWILREGSTDWDYRDLPCFTAWDMVTGVITFEP
jgi:hypothetical protein